MKKLVACLVLSIMAVSSSCNGISVEIDDNSETTTIGDLSLIKLSDIYYYDKNTKIVFLWNGSSSNLNNATSPTPYPAANGLPYRYNEETGEMEEINPKVDLKTGGIIYE